MALHQDLTDLFSALSAAEARFMVAGDHAATHYASPRFAKEELWVEPTVENASRVRAALDRIGVPLDDLSLQDLAEPGLIFQLGRASMRVGLRTSQEGLRFDDCWARKEPSTFGGVPINLLHVEDLREVEKRRAQPPSESPGLSGLPAR